MRRVSVLALCMARATAAAGDDVSPWAVFKTTHRASRVAAFIALWAVAIRELGEDASHGAIQRDLNESRATFYRRLSDFRELFPEHDDPTPLALLVLDAAGADRPSTDTLVVA